MPQTQGYGGGQFVKVDANWSRILYKPTTYQYIYKFGMDGRTASIPANLRAMKANGIAPNIPIHCFAHANHQFRGIPYPSQRDDEGNEATALQISDDGCKCYISEDGEFLYQDRGCPVAHGEPTAA